MKADKDELIDDILSGIEHIPGASFDDDDRETIRKALHKLALRELHALERSTWRPGKRDPQLRRV